MGPVFELQLVHRGIGPKALKRGTINMTYSEMVDHYFFQLAEEEHIDRDALTAEQQLALAEAERQYDARLDWPHAEPVPHTEENVLGVYWDGEKQVCYWADNVPVHIKKQFDKMLASPPVSMTHRQRGEPQHD
jgi:CO/xanthine dehydrogenase Mo-binding subunit